MKKLTALLTAAFLFILMLSPGADATGDLIAANMVRKSDVVVHTGTSFQQIFNIPENPPDAGQNSTNATTEACQVTYHYSLEPVPDAQEADVALDFTISVSGRDIPILASGTIQAYALPDGRILWDGPLDSHFMLDGVSFEATVSFSKLNTDPDIKATVNMYPVDAEAEGSLTFSFGKNIFTEEIWEQLTEAEGADKQQATSSGQGEMLPLALPSDFKPVKDILWVTFSERGMHRWRALGLTGYSNNVTNEIIIALRTSGRNAFDALLVNHPEIIRADTYIYELNCRLYSNSYHLHDNTYAAIDYVDCGTVAQNLLDGQSNVLLKALLKQALIKIGIPDIIVSSALNTVNSRVTVSQTAEEANIKMQFGVSEVDLDSLSPGIPILFRVIPAAKDYVGRSAFTYSGNVTYRSVCYDGSAFSPYSIYSHSKNAEQVGYFPLTS